MTSVAADPGVGVIEPEPLGAVDAAPEWRMLGRLEKTAIGTRGSDGVTKVRRREPAGCLLYGPYWQLPGGAYRLQFRCRCGKPRMPGQPVLGVEVIAMNRVQLAWLDLTEEELRTEMAVLDFSVPAQFGLGAGDEARLEFRFFHMGNADLTVTAVDLSAVLEARPAPARVWRMLGRLEKAAIGKRIGERVTVRQVERAGCLLDGGQPLLQLPEGRYRLNFRCEAGSPRMPKEPVLGVEVMARRRWRDDRAWSWISLVRRPTAGAAQLIWRDFTAPELHTGSGSIDLAVPAELSLEAGQDVVIGIRFVHLGNADLSIAAVELRQTAEETAQSVPLSEWRLLGRLVKGKLGIREPDCVSVRQVELPGCLLRGGRPALRLPEGRYRLSFCCRAGLPRSASAPVLGVEVVARPPPLPFRLERGQGRKWARAWRSLLRPQSSVQARRNFSAEALRADWATVEFDAPAELSRDGNERVSFDFRFLHLGNADLAISAVCLQKIAVAEEPFHISSQFFTGRSKTNLLIIGNCQALTVYEGLVRASEFNRRLDARYHFVGLQQNLHELGKSELQNSDVLLVQDIRDWENYPLRPHVRDDVRIIKFPLLHFASLWPFDHYNGPGDKEAYQREWPNLTFLYHDGLLARLRKEIPDQEQRLAAYRSLSLDGVINFARLHDFEKRRLLAMDKQFELQIGQFILDNFQRRRLFHTTNHPNAEIMVMLIQYLLAQLGIDQVYRPIASLDHLKRLQVPVHPKVAQALGVKWANDNTKYLYGGEQITWETYVRRYIEHYG